MSETAAAGDKPIGKLIGKLSNGVPLSTAELLKAGELVKACSNEELVELGLGPPPAPILPKNLERIPVRQRMKVLQDFINCFRYNFNPGYHFNVNKQRSFARIMDTARDMIRDMLPIKCIEAVFLSLYLTCGWVGVDRLPLSFKTICQGHTYRHIVLVIHHRATSRFGVLGISRRDNLMYKDLVYKDLSELITDFKRSYGEWGHALQKVHVGLNADHNPYSTSPVCWRCCTVSPENKAWEDVCSIFNDYSSKVQQLQDKFRVSGTIPDFAEKCY